VERKFRNKLFHKDAAHNASVVFRFQDKCFNEKIACGEKRAGVLCVRHRDRTREGKCCSNVDKEFSWEARERWKRALFNSNLYCRNCVKSQDKNPLLVLQTVEKCTSAVCI
jgi:hypothetical protein